MKENLLRGDRMDIGQVAWDVHLTRGPAGEGEVNMRRKRQADHAKLLPPSPKGRERESFGGAGFVKSEESKKLLRKLTPLGKESLCSV